MGEPVPSGGALPEGLLVHFADQRDLGTDVDRPSVEPPADAVADAVVLALHEDLAPDGDVSAALVPDDAVADGVIASRAAGVLAGSSCATEAFAQVSPDIDLVWLLADGDRLVPGDVVATVRGPLAAVLTAERTALNFLGRLSGVASATARWVEAADAVDGLVRIWDTRKTTPGLRALERAAVRAGGGWNHRTNLSHWVMLKDNHLTGTDISSAVASSRSLWPGRTVHVECETLDQVRESLEAGADALLLDNMTPASIKMCVAVVHAHGERHGTRPLIEASGGITLDRVAEVAATGVDCISTSALTNGAPSLDLGLDLNLESGSRV